MRIPLTALVCRLIGHRWYEPPQLIIGQRRTSPDYCDRCFADRPDQLTGGSRG